MFNLHKLQYFLINLHETNILYGNLRLFKIFLVVSLPNSSSLERFNPEKMQCGKVFFLKILKIYGKIYLLIVFYGS